MKIVFMLLGMSLAGLLGLIASRVGLGIDTWQFYVLVLPTSVLLGIAAAFAGEVADKL